MSNKQTCFRFPFFLVRINNILNVIGDLVNSIDLSLKHILKHVEAGKNKKDINTLALTAILKENVLPGQHHMRQMMHVQESVALELQLRDQALFSNSQEQLHD